MPLDPELEVLLLEAGALRLKAISESTVEEARQAVASRPRAAGQDVAEVSELAIPVADGALLRARCYRPLVASGDEPGPGLVFFHGGGWVLCDLDTHDATCRALANAAGCTVVSVGYRLAPEYRFPVAVDDAEAAARWVAANAASLRIDRRRLGVGGDSAGGNLAAVAARRLRDASGPPLAAQLLVYPVTDYDFARQSMLDNADGYGLTPADMRWFWDKYLPPGTDPFHPDAAPLRAADLAGLPPAVVVTAEYDPLRDEGAEYARCLADAGVRAHHLDGAGLTHGFIGMTGAVRLAAAILDEAGALLAGLLSEAGRQVGPAAGQEGDDLQRASTA